MRVKVNNDLSETIQQLSGIPEGSVLGPICFVLFINDLTSVVKYCKIKLYADDVKIYFRFKSEQWSGLLQRDLDAVVEWSKMWQLCISLTKTFMLHIGTKNPQNNYNISGTVITVVDKIKDLGIYVTSNLSWSVHVHEVVKKANKMCNVILHAFVSRNVDLYMSAFAIYVIPILDYCCYVWNPTLCRDIDLIENIQKAYTRRVFRKCGLPRMCYSDRLVYLNINSVEYARFMSCLTMFYSIYHKFVTCNVLEGLHPPTHSFNLRGHDKRLFIPYCKSNVRKTYFVFRFLKIWNILPDYVIRTNVRKAFQCYINELNVSTYYKFRY
jgi:hypothetical protein